MRRGVLQARGAVVLHSVRVLSSPKHFETFPTERFVLLNGVVVIPDAIGLPEFSAAGHDLRKPLFREHAATYEIVAAKAVGICGRLRTRIRGEDHCVAFILDANGETESG